MDTHILNIVKGFPSGSDGKESACNTGDLSLIPGSGISPGEENGNLLQYSCLENPMDRGTWSGVTKKEADTMEHTSFPLEGLLHPGGGSILPGMVSICP